MGKLQISIVILSALRERKTKIHTFFSTFYWRFSENDWIRSITILFRTFCVFDIFGLHLKAWAWKTGQNKKKKKKYSLKCSEKYGIGVQFVYIVFVCVFIRKLCFDLSQVSFYFFFTLDFVRIWLNTHRSMFDAWRAQNIKIKYARM